MNEDLKWRNQNLSNIYYDPESGVFKWKSIPRGARKDGLCGHEHTDSKGNKYLIINTGGIMYRAHRLAWFLYYGENPPEEIDHIDGNGLNNKISNLRKSNSHLNKKNRHKQKNNTSGITGVIKHSTGSGYTAMIQHKGVQHYLGYFLNIEDAKMARLNAEDRFKFENRHGKESKYV